MRDANIALMTKCALTPKETRQLLESDAHFDLGPTIKDLARLPRVLQAGRLGGT
jgi:hypothetical protein